MTDGSELVPLLKQLLVPGTLGTVVGIVLSLVIDLWPKFKEYGPKMKRLAFFAAGFLISLGASLCIAAITNAFNWDHILAAAIVATLGSWGAGTLAHTRELPSG